MFLEIYWFNSFYSITEVTKYINDLSNLDTKVDSGSANCESLSYGLSDKGDDFVIHYVRFDLHVLKWNK